MEYKKYIKESNLISATEKAFNVIYKSQGYKLYDEPAESDESEDNDAGDVIVYDEITRAEIVDKLEEKGIEHNSKDNKQELYDLLLGSD